MKAYLFATEIRDPLDQKKIARVYYHVTYGTAQEPALKREDFRATYTLEDLALLSDAIEKNVLNKIFRPMGKRRTKITNLQNKCDVTSPTLNWGNKRPLNNQEIKSLTAKVQEALRH